jgi:beta-aspartyl-peptidase (threonine type)
MSCFFNYNSISDALKKVILLCTCFTVITTHAQPADKTKNKNIVLLIHGGAGSISKATMTPENVTAYTEALRQALQAGFTILKTGGTALDAVETSVRMMEDNPLFNAGKGAVLNNEGRAELDASVMDGKTLAAGAVACVTTIKNPVSAARKVMEKSPHVLLMGKGAEQFATMQGLEIVDPSYFLTNIRRESLQKINQQDSLKGGQDSVNQKSSLKPQENMEIIYGTVGAVALDRNGNLAAATSTGGMGNKLPGRVGDSPLIGAGTYASNATCAISCTGWGEYFIRLVVAKTVSDLMEFKNYTVQQAADEMIYKKVPQLGGDGGLIAIDKNGNMAMPFNTPGMFRAYIKSDGKPVIKMYGPKK